MFGLIWRAATRAAAAFVFMKARDFVRGRLTYVDAAQRPIAPVVSGIATAVIATPIALIHPLGMGAAILLGISVGAGVAAGGRANRKRLGDGSAS